MEQSQEPQQQQEPTLVEKLLELGTRAFNPTTTTTTENTPPYSPRNSFDDFVAATKTITLIPALNALISPGRVPEWLRHELVRVLTRIPMRTEDGVRATMEFVFSVHPDSVSTKEEASMPQKRGAFITPESLKAAAKLVASPPTGVTPDEWFAAVAPQLFFLLDRNEGPELVKAAGHIIGHGILGRKEYGAIGTPGFNTFVHPILSNINPSLPDPRPSKGIKPLIKQEDEIFDLRSEVTLVTPETLSLSLKRLHSLIHMHGHPGLARRLIRPVLLPLWALASWMEPTDECCNLYCSPASDLLKIYIRLHASNDDTRCIIKNLLFKGQTTTGTPRWRFDSTLGGLIQVLKIRHAETHVSSSTSPFTVFDAESLAELDPKSTILAEILDSVSTADEISSIFLDLFKQWFTTSRKQPSKKNIVIKHEDNGDPLVQLLEAKVLQTLMEKAPKKLIGHPDQILELVNEVLAEATADIPAITVDTATAKSKAAATKLEKDDGENSSTEGPTAIALSLLNILLSSPGFSPSSIPSSTLSSLSTLASSPSSPHAKTAESLSYLLTNWSAIIDSETDHSLFPTSLLPAKEANTATVRELEDRKTYTLALSYITSPTAPPPVRSQGLALLSNLTSSASPSLDVPALLVLLSSILEEQESDDVLVLRAIKLFVKLSSRHPLSTLREILSRYLDEGEHLELDARLRFGEAMNQVLDAQGEMFGGDIGGEVCRGLLGVCGRRGGREKSAKRAEREEQASERKRQKEAMAWGGSLPPPPSPDSDSSEDEDGEDGEDEHTKKIRRENNKLLTTIITGWTSTRGKEDIRIRASALSLLGKSLETSFLGVGPEVAIAVVDTSMDILTLEREAEMGILRRAAVIATLSFLRGLDGLRQRRQGGNGDGFDLTGQSREKMVRVLRYVMETDCDGLVREYAGDTLESLEAWEMGKVVGRDGDVVVPRGVGRGEDGFYGKVAGIVGGARRGALGLGMGQPGDNGNGVRPRIEEVED